jgi:hypothetical protein
MSTTCFGWFVYKRSLFCSIHLTPFRLQVSCVLRLGGCKCRFALSAFAALGHMCLPCRQPPEAEGGRRFLGTIVLNNKSDTDKIILYFYLLTSVTYLYVMNNHIYFNICLLEGVSLRRGVPSNGYNIL